MPTQNVPRIYTRCPACKNDTLTINKGHLLCTWHQCPDPILLDRVHMFVNAGDQWRDLAPNEKPQIGDRVQMGGAWSTFEGGEIGNVFRDKRWQRRYTPGEPLPDLYAAHHALTQCSRAFGEHAIPGSGAWELGELCRNALQGLCFTGRTLAAPACTCGFKDVVCGECRQPQT